MRSAQPPLKRLSLATAAAFAGILVAAGCNNGNQPKPLPPRYVTLPPKVVPDFLKGTIFERVDLTNTDPLIVNNYGLVVNLNSTGDSNAPLAIREYVIKQMMKAGIGSSRELSTAARMQPDEMLKDPRVAIVRVDGPIPAGARKGQRFDVVVSALDSAQNNTTSLAGGLLYRTDLQIGGAAAPGRVIDNQAVCQGPVFVNPEYALRDPKDPAVKQSLRYGTIPGGGVVLKDRSIILRLRAPDARNSRAMEVRIDTFFQDQNVAAAFDEGIVQLYMPASFKGDWEHFAGLATRLYFDSSAEFSASKARELAAEAVKPDAPLLDISYCWEGLGRPALPVVLPLMNNKSPDVAFAAARAAAYIGDSSALSVLSDIAHDSHNPFQVSAVQLLGSLKNSPVVNQMLRGLLDSPETTVRIQAYRVLADAGDASIYSKVIDGKFVLDIVPSKGPPMIYATRRGSARLAIFGQKPALNIPAAFSALDNRLTITSGDGERAVKIFYRDPAVSRPVPILSNPDIAEIVARLGGEGPDDAPQKLDFSYGEIVAIMQSMTHNAQVVAMSDGRRQNTPFVLQESPRVQDEVDTAPTIPERQMRPQGDTTEQPLGAANEAAPATGAAPKPSDAGSGTSRVEARK